MAAWECVHVWVCVCVCLSVSVCVCLSVSGCVFEWELWVTPADDVEKNFQVSASDVEWEFVGGRKWEL